MPDLIRHPDIVPTKVGNHFKDWIPAFAGMTMLIEVAIYKQTLMNPVPIRGADNRDGANLQRKG